MLALIGAGTAHAQNGSDIAAPRPIFSTPREFPALEGPVDPNEYILGPGDELELALLGRAPARITLVLDAEGAVFLPNVGHVVLAGLSLSQGRARISQRFAAEYKGVRADVTLSRPRRIRVHVTGEVRAPGIVELQAPARAWEAVRAAGDTTALGSLRNIRLTQRGGVEQGADLESYLRLGDRGSNPLLSDGDVVVVPARAATIEVRGEVARPGLLEFRAGDNVQRVLELCGGLRPWADSSRVEIWHFDGPTQASMEAADLRGAGLRELARPGDRIYVRSIPGWHRRASVSVYGEVNRPGTYAIDPAGEMASSLLQRVDGLTSFANVSSALVLRPGAVPLRDTVYAELLQDGGRNLSHDDLEYLKMRALARGALVMKLADVGTGGHGSPGSGDFRLLDGDIVVVPAHTHSVAVYGAVRRPGVLPFSAGQGLGDYVDLAGGWGDHADRGRVRITHLGTAEPVPAGNVSTIAEGDIVWVPTREPRNLLSSVGSVISVMAQIATVLLVIQQATK